MNQSAATPLSEHVRIALTNAAKRQGETTLIATSDHEHGICAIGHLQELCPPPILKRLLAEARYPSIAKPQVGAAIELIWTMFDPAHEVVDG